VPYVAKSTGNSIAAIATKIMTGKKLVDFELNRGKSQYYTFKECIFPFARFDSVDTILGPEMKSTGEVMGIDRNLLLAFAKAQISVGNFATGKSTNVLISLDDVDKEKGVDLAQKLYANGYNILTTEGTGDYFKSHHIPITILNKKDTAKNSVSKLIESKDLELAIVTTVNPKNILTSKKTRRGILMNRIPYVTTIRSAGIMVEAIIESKKMEFSITALQEI